MDYLGECDDKQYEESMSQYMLRCAIKSELSKARKETAKEILNDISKEIRIEEDIHREEYHIYVYKEGVFRLMKKFKEEYGVEAEE